MQPLLLHHHLAKNAGTSLRQVIRANFKPGELYENYDLSPWMPSESWWRDWYLSLTPERRERLRCVGAHSAQALLPVVDDRPVRAFTMLRDPVGRVTSLYAYALRQARRAGELGKRPTGRLALVILDRGWALDDVYRELGGLKASEASPEFQLFFNGQAREILGTAPELPAAPFSAGRDRLDSHRRRALEILSGTYVVGTQDRFSQSVRLFADSFGWRRTFLPRQNVTQRRGPEISPETRELILTYNALDAELHAHFSDRLRGLPAVSRLSQRRWRVRRGLGRLKARVPTRARL